MTFRDTGPGGGSYLCDALLDERDAEISDRTMTSADSVLTIGAVLGDSDANTMAWSRAIGDFSRKIEELSVGVPTPVRVNVVYHVDGRISPNEFEGVRTGRFDRAKASVVVQAAVPAQMPDQPQELLSELLAAAIAEAEAFARRKKLADDLGGLRTLAERVGIEGDSSEPTVQPLRCN